MNFFPHGWNGRKINYTNAKKVLSQKERCALPLAFSPQAPGMTKAWALAGTWRRAQETELDHCQYLQAI